MKQLLFISLIISITSCTWNRHIQKHEKLDFWGKIDDGSLTRISQDTLINGKEYNYIGKYYKNGDVCFFGLYSNNISITETSYYKNGNYRSHCEYELCDTCSNLLYERINITVYDKDQRPLWKEEFFESDSLANGFKRYFDEHGNLSNERHLMPIYQL